MRSRWSNDFALIGAHSATGAHERFAISGDGFRLPALRAHALGDDGFANDAAPDIKDAKPTLPEAAC